MTGQWRWTDCFSGPIIEHKEVSLLRRRQKTGKNTPSDPERYSNRTFCNSSTRLLFDCCGGPLNKFYLFIFLFTFERWRMPLQQCWMRNKVLMLSFQGAGGGGGGGYFAAEARIKRGVLGIQDTTLFRNQLLVRLSKIDFICLRSQTRPPFSPPLSLWHFKLSQLSSLSSFALLRPSHPAPFNICFICLSPFSLSKAQRKSRHIF